MGCLHSLHIEEPEKCDAVQNPKETQVCQRTSSEKRRSTICSIRAALLIQKWYRRYQARLEVKRRCAWMIYQSLEYAGELNHLKLYNLYNDLILYADNQNFINNSAEASQETLDNEKPTDSQIWNTDLVPPVPNNYQGPRLNFPLDMAQVAQLMESFTRNQKLHPRYVFDVLNESKQLLVLRPNIQQACTSISRQITVVGDLHGQFNDLQMILFKNGMPDVTNPYIFNGDFVDRGRKSVETFVTILCLMLMRPSAVFLNRGNHEDHFVNCQYGFVKELQKKYKSVAGPLVKCFSEIYRYLPLATIIDNSTFVCHGGLSDETQVKILENINRFTFYTFLKPLNRNGTRHEDKKHYQDILWSDPHPVMGAKPNEQRGMGCWFGPDITAKFLQDNNLKLLIRSHECKSEGFEWAHDHKLLTIFSASNYYADGSNRGAFVRITAEGDVQTVQFVTGGNKKFKTMQQRVSFAEESALTDLKQKILAHTDELKYEFLLADPDNTGFVTVAKWCAIMQKGLDLKLPWRTLQPRLAATSKTKNMVEYMTTFEKLNVSNAIAKAPPSVTEEMYKHRDVLEVIFRAMDKDSSGLISLTEFQAACLRLPNRTTLDEQSITDMARSIDINKDGQIDFNEFLEAFRLVESDRERYEHGEDSQLVDD